MKGAFQSPSRPQSSVYTNRYPLFTVLQNTFWSSYQMLGKGCRCSVTFPTMPCVHKGQTRSSGHVHCHYRWASTVSAAEPTGNKHQRHWPRVCRTRRVRSVGLRVDYQLLNACDRLACSWPFLSFTKKTKFQVSGIGLGCAAGRRWVEFDAAF